ncbi:MAG: 3,4-dihydroxy-2-butanone 4-phosphate synthase [Desulfobacterales bacterium SG8_35_2]|nr:MAG: 3,4-dihydroxy-2-butanone 4-phosphate synthase [Desulfobacterales bacterium SG8_35_2]
MGLLEETKQQEKKSSVFCSVEEALEAFQKGEMLIMIDDEERENEGDFVVAAEETSPEIINFMTKHGRGLICVGITRERACELNLDYQVKINTALHHTPFSISIDAIEGTTTGISAFDRSKTIQELVSDSAKPEDFGRPGHIFPLIASSKGVIKRPGHTEAVVDLARLAGLKPAGVLCEILNEDGTMARLPQLIKISKHFDIKLVSIGDLIEYRLKTEKLVKPITEVDLPCNYGQFRLRLYENIIKPTEHHIALVKGNPTKNNPTLVRVHSECLTGDILGSRRCDCGPQLHTALSKIEEEQEGILIYLRQEGRGIGLVNKILAYKLQDNGKDTVEANEALGFKADLREYWLAAQILKDMDITEVELMTNNPRKVNDLSKYGIRVSKRIPLMIDPNPSNQRYLRTKKEKLGHLIIFNHNNA